MNYEEKAKNFVQTFQSFTREQQSDVLKQILLKCQPLQLRLLYSELKPLLAVDFVTFLPKELAERIFSYLPVKSLSCVARCNRLWRERSNHNPLWYRLCVQRGWDKFGEDLLETSQGSVPPPDSGSLQPPISRWKNIFIRAHSLKENWALGRYTVAPLLRGHKERINTLACNGSIIVSGSSDNTARVWDVKAAKCLYVFDSPHTDSIRCVSLKDNLFVTGCADSVIRLFDVKSGRCMRSFHGHTGGVEHLSFDGHTIISASADLTVRVWNVDTGQPIHTLSGHSDEIQVLVQHGDLVITASWDETVRLWNIKSGSCLLTLRGHTEAVYCCDFNEKKIVSGGGDGLVKIWDALTGDNTFTLVGHTGEVYCVQFNDCVIVSGSADSTVRLWSHQGVLLHTLNEHIGVVRCLYLSGSRLISGGDRKRIAVWDVEEGKLLSVVHRNPSLLHLMWANETKLITASPETPGIITIINYW